MTQTKVTQGRHATPPSLKTSSRNISLSCHTLIELTSLPVIALSDIIQAYQKLNAMLYSRIFLEIIFMALGITCYGVPYCKLTSQLTNYQLI